MTKGNTSGLVRSSLLIAGILIIAANLRAPFTSVAPLLGKIRDAFALDTSQVGILTTLPLLAFAFASPFCARLARRYGLERSLFIALAIIAFGIAVRSSGSVWMLFVGSAVIGIGIAVANVLLPALLKREFPRHVATLTSAYVMASAIFAALASVAVVPIATLPSSDWSVALGVSIVLPLSAMILWFPRIVNRATLVTETPVTFQGGPLWRSALAWQVTIFFGLNSLIYYVMVTWLPAILIEAGYSAEMAGSLHGLSQLGAAIPGLLLAPVIGRMKDHRGIAAGTALIGAAALLGLICLPDLALLWVLIYGFGTGATFILALSFVGLRTMTSRQAGILSGLVQSIGYTLAAMGPPLVGFIHDLFSGWLVPLSLCLALSCVTAWCGYLSGRSGHIE